MFRKGSYLILFLLFSYCQVGFGQVIQGNEQQARNEQQIRKDTAFINLVIATAKKRPYDADSNIAMLERAFALSRDINYPTGLAGSLLGIGTNFFNKGELEVAKKLFRQAYPYCLQSPNKRQLLLSWNNNMGSVYTTQGLHDSAVVYYYNALKVITPPASKFDSGMACVIYSNISSVWLKAAQFQQSLFYARKALELSLAMHDSDRTADIYQNIGVDLTSFKDSIPHGLSYLHAALAIHLSRHNYAGAQMDCCALGINANSADSSIFYYRKGLAFSKLTGMQPLHKIFIGMGYAFLQKKLYDSAAKYLEQGYARATELHFTDDLTFIYSGFAEIYTAKGNYRLANKYQKLYSDLRDSLINNEKILAVNTLDVKYRSAEKDRQIAEARLQLIRRDYSIKRRNTVILLVGLTVAFLIVVFVLLYRSVRRKMRYEQQQLINVKQQQQIEQLKSVMAGEEKERTRIARELHDGIMVQLAVIKMRLRRLKNAQQENNGAEMSGVLQQLDDTSRELRQTAHNLMPDMLLETGLTDAVFYYCSAIEKETGLRVIFQAYGNLPRLSQEAELYVYRIIQELLQNIIKHAHASKALVQMNYHPPLLSVAVEDNGIGFDKRLVEGGMGLKSIDSRLKVLGGTIDIQSSSRNATTIFIEINIEPFIIKTTNHADTRSHS